MIGIGVKCSKPGRLQIFYSLDGNQYNEQVSTSTDIQPSNIWVQKTLNLPRFIENHLLTDLRFDPPVESDFSMSRPEIKESGVRLLENTGPQEFDMKRLPFVWAAFDDKRAIDRTPILLTGVIGNTSVAGGELRTIHLPGDPDKSTGNYLQLVILSPNSGRVELSYGQHQHSKIWFNLEASGEEEQYLIRISTQWVWMSEKVHEINFRPSVPVILKSCFIRKGD